MKIQENAKEFAKDYSRSERHLVAHAYYCGALDQRNDDIEKACKWWVDKLNSSEPIDFEKWAEEFRKSMECEQ